MQNALTQSQVQTMLRLQGSMNSKVDPDWVLAGYPYLRAVVVEAAEAIEHHGWKWWKKQSCDMAQLQMEIVDIWHFLLSELLLRNQGDEAKTTRELYCTLESGDSTGRLQFDGKHFNINALTLLEKLELLIGLATAGRIELELFDGIMLDCEMRWDDLYTQYVSKNVLNFFRQDYGYKQGTYQKIWHGKEDNEHLVDVMNTLQTDAEDFPQQLYKALAERYPA
jgi:hypothetical protein